MKEGNDRKESGGTFRPGVDKSQGLVGRVGLVGLVQLIESRTGSPRYVVASLARIWRQILRVLDYDGTRYVAAAMSAQEALKVVN